ncbi:MAG: ribose-phosphate diphosphokinase [Desulfonatronovibrio sp.]
MIKVLHCPQMAEVADRLCENNDLCRPGEISWKIFRDGFPDIKISRAAELRNRHVVFLASFENPSEIFRQLSVIYELPRLAVQSLKVVLPYFSTGTMERVEQEGEIATASTLARMLSHIPGTLSGPVQIIIYDIHALQERFYFSDNVIPRLETAIPLLLQRIKKIRNVAVAFPDQGAWKRFGRMFQGYPLITAHKIREGNGRRVIIQEGRPQGRHVVIVDDLVMTGGTLIKCRDALMEAGAAKVSAYVTHGVFPDKSWQRFCGRKFAAFWMTDSCPGTVKEVDGQEPFEVLSLADDIAAKISADIIS